MTRGTGPADRGGRDELTAPDKGPGGKPHLPVLLNSGSGRSLISFDHFQQLSRGDPNLQLGPTGVKCNGVGAEFGNFRSSKGEA
jgi:hypothetical protein